MTTPPPRPAPCVVFTVCCAAVMLFAGGCIPSEPLPPERMDQYWSIPADPTVGAEYYRPHANGTEIPSRWVIRQHPSVIWSTVSIVRATETLDKGATEVQFAVSPDHADIVIDLLSETRSMLESLRDVLDAANVGEERWAETIAGVLTDVEYIVRGATVREVEDMPRRTEPAGIAAGPVLRMMTMVLDQQSGGALLGDLGEEDVGRLRTVLTQVSLRLGFAAAGKQQPDGLREQLLERMRDSEDFAALRDDLHAALAEAVREAPPAPEGEQLRSVVLGALRGAPKALEALEGLIAQWDRVDQVVMELYRDGDSPVLAVTLSVLPGREVRPVKLAFYQPTLAFRGTSRMVVIPDVEGTGATAVLFQPDEDGGVELRFEGIVYALARLFAFPLADGKLREIRYAGGGQADGASMTNVALLMEATGRHRDPRRMLVFQDTRRKRLVRGVFEVRSVTELERQVVNYLTPDRRYTFERNVAEHPPAGR